MKVEPSWYLMVSAAMFAIGLTGILIRRNTLVIFMCVELMLNAVNLTFVTFANAAGNRDGQIAVFVVMVVAAAEITVGLGLVVALMRRRPSASADDISVLKG